MAAAAPPMDGVEYLTRPLLEKLWSDIADAFRFRLEKSSLSVRSSYRSNTGRTRQRPRRNSRWRT
jgi:hypothetical protein